MDKVVASKKLNMSASSQSLLRSIPILLTLSLAWGQVAPSWVTKRPVDPGSYIGIGEVDMKGKSTAKYQEEAKNRALAEISEQIYTTISTSYEETLQEGSGISVEEVSAMLKSSSSEDIEGAEKIDSYADGKKFWVYWKLDKRKHEKNAARYTDQSKDYYQKSKETIPGFETVSELSYLVKAYEAIHRAHGKLVEIETEDGKILINSEVQNRLEEIINNIETRTINNKQQGQKGDPLQRDLIFKATYVGLMDVVLKGLPIEYKVITGDMVLDKNVSTDSQGEAASKVREIKSDITNQLVQAIIDLKQFKERKVPNVVFDKMLDDISKKRAGNYSITVSKLKAENLAVKVLSENGISSMEILNLTDGFISEIKEQTKFNVMERQTIDDVLEAQGFNSECSTDECLIEINKITPVDHMIFVILNAKAESGQFSGDIISKEEARIMEKEFGWTYRELKEGKFRRFEAGEKTYRGSIKLTNIESSNIEGQTQIKFAGTMDELLDQGIIKKWINKFYSSINLPVVSFVSSINNIQVFMDGKYWNDLPIREEVLQPAKYKMQFSLSGFETMKKTYNLVLGQKIEERIELDEKTRTEAFVKSLIFPGYGQWYSSDNTHNSRRVTGTVFAIAYVGSLFGTGLMWNEYLTTKTNYDNSVVDYNEQEVMTEIESYRKVMEDNHTTMASAKSNAGVITGVLATVWLSSALEAMLRFPTDYGASVSFSYDPVLHSRQLSLHVDF